MENLGKGKTEKTHCCEDVQLWKRFVEEMPLRSYVKSVEDGLTYTFCNSMLCEALGKRADEVEGRRVGDLFPPDVAECFAATTQATLEQGAPNTVDEFDWDRDGARRELRTMEKIYTAPNGRRYVFGYSLDVTEKNTLLRLEQTIDDIAALPIEGGDFLLEVFNVVTRDDRMDVLELHWCTRNGKDNRVVRSPLERESGICAPTPETRREVWRRLRARVDADGLAVHANFAHEAPPELARTFPKEAPPCLAVLPVHSRRRGVVGDIVLVFRARQAFTTSYREMLKLLGRTLSVARTRILTHRRLERQLERAEEAERAKSYFFASVSHDIRTPLNSIIGFSELLKAGPLDEATHRQYVEAIADSGRALLQLVNDVLDLAKLEAGKIQISPAPTDFRRVAREIAIALLPQAQTKGLRLDAEIPSDLPLVEIDRQRIRQVLVNLVGNAVKFTDRGFVQISATFVPDPSGAPHGVFRFDVTDTGRGISAEDQTRLMQPFVQLARTDQGHGTGLGLAICRRLVEHMHGALTIKSAVGQGSRFRVELPGVRFAHVPPPAPVSPPRAPRLQPVRAPNPSSPRAAPLRLLLVDDMKLNLCVLRNLFRRLGVEDLVATCSGREALAELEKNDPPFDAVLTDLWMPEMGGDALVRQIRADARFATLPVYAVTADVSVLKNYRDIGFSGLLLKPVTLQSLTEYLENFNRAVFP